MFKLFRIEDKTLQPIQIAPEWTYLKTSMQYNLTRVKNYYRNTTSTVPASHLLVRLLQSLPISKTTDIDTYYRQVNSIALSHSMGMQMTSAYYRGKFFTGVFYGKRSLECLLVVDDSFNHRLAHDNWKDLVAVKPILHDKTDMKLLLPDGVDYSDELSSSIVLINLPMLAIQYRAFYLEHMSSGNVNAQKSTMNFVAQYVIPNMLNAHLDLCFINRLISRYYNNNNTPVNYTKKHPFALIELDSQIDRVIDKLLDYINKAPKRFDLILKTIPSFEKQNAYSALIMPDIAPTKQVHWATMLSRLKYIAFLFDISGKDVLTVNQSEVNEVITELNYGDIYNVFKYTLPSELFFKAQNNLDTLASLLTNPNAFKH
jgi:hypothetical protein